uniref:Uncharacterized protein n=1 Tax=Lactuca sativa TaxID=4236 RepID=A0A9R1VNX8_LACSA|nr:hypothetical protein LSAT_V11C400186140 [Lactuca sativa]
MKTVIWMTTGRDFTLSNPGMFRMGHIDAILPPRQSCVKYNLIIVILQNLYGAIMVVGASNPIIVANKDGYFNVKSSMLMSFS